MEPGLIDAFNAALATFESATQADRAAIISEADGQAKLAAAQASLDAATSALAGGDAALAQAGADLTAAIAAILAARPH